MRIFGLGNWMRSNQERTKSTPLHQAIRFLNKETRHIEALTKAASEAAKVLPVPDNVVDLRAYIADKPLCSLVMPENAPTTKQ